MAEPKVSQIVDAVRNGFIAAINQHYVDRARVVPDAGTTEELQPQHGKPLEIVPCPRLHQKGHDENCEVCGGNGQRRVCNLNECYEYGCQGSGYCDAPSHQINRKHHE